MKKILSIFDSLLFFYQLSAKDNKSDDLKSIFNGKNLDGWSQKWDCFLSGPKRCDFW